MFNPSTLTAQDFKDYFPSDFQYQPVWSALITYNAGDLVYYTDNNYYICLLNGTTSANPPPNSLHWQLSSLPIPPGTYVTDFDITKSYGESLITYFASKFADSDDAGKIAYLYLSAHYLFINRTRTAGGRLVNSKTAGSISQSYSVPEWALSNPVYSNFSQSYYGSRYLALLSPRLNVGLTVNTPSIV